MAAIALTLFGIFLLLVLGVAVKRRRTSNAKPAPETHAEKPVVAHIPEQPLQRELRAETREHLKEWREQARRSRDVASD